MKKIAVTGLILFLITLAGSAQTRVEADSIIDQINRGEPVRYEKAQIVGDLELIALENMTEKRIRGKSTSWDKVRESRRRWGFSSRTYWAHIESPVAFVDCVFEGDVIAYRHDDRRRETYNVIFHDDAFFTGCEFRRQSEFKYCKFEEKADFRNNRYHEEALFKYVDFSSAVSFADSTFEGYAHFKYAEFPEGGDFSKGRFQDGASFKYARFHRRAGFGGAVFESHADFKYTKFSGDLDFDGADFERGGNFKYTRHNGRRFSPLALRSPRALRQD